MGLYLQKAQTILQDLVHFLHEIPGVGADVTRVKCQQDSCVPMLYVMSSSNPSTGLPRLSQRLGIGVKNSNGSTWVATGNTDGKGDASIKIPVKEVIFTSWF